jgi:hypothetical protein
MPDQTVQRKQRGGYRSALASGVVEALALEEQGCSVELEPPFEHVALAEKVRRLDPTGILQILYC